MRVLAVTGAPQSDGRLYTWEVVLISNACTEATKAWDKYGPEITAFRKDHEKAPRERLARELRATPKRILAAHKKCNGHSSGPFVCDCPCGGSDAARAAVGGGPI